MGGAAAAHNIKRRLKIMKNYYNELNKIIVLAAIANAAEEFYSKYPELEHAERAFDEAYKAEFNANALE